ncbi:MAG: beta-galactosidase [Candidatus Daviesbacteria bacterium]|nr:beta-galactosidase [Candidatus Daviesbacteria bacterium]
MKKNKPLIFMLIALVILGIFVYFLNYQAKVSSKIQYGVTFTPKYAEYLGFKWQEVLLLILKELGVKELRLTTYWEQVEPLENEYYFDDILYQLDKAHQYQAKVLLVVGAKQPRWPECHYPSWAKTMTLKERQSATLRMIESVVTRLKFHPAITSWQVENEPLFGFGENCDPSDPKFLKSEVELVRKLDPNRKIIVTDTGEWRPWITPMQVSDILGISLYRRIHHPFLGYVTYPFSPGSYQLRSNIIRNLFAPKNQKTIITELQTEPWLINGVKDSPISEQVNIFSPQDFQDNIEFGENTGFDQFYLWGVEWWLYMKENGYPEYWEYAKKVFN